MRLRLATDTLLDTYAPSGYEGLHGRVVKRPDGHGGYEMAASFDGSRNTVLDESSLRQVTHMFNMDLHMIQMQNRCPGT